MVLRLENFLNEHLRGPHAILNEVLVAGMGIGEEVPYSHCVAILKAGKSDNLIISDCAADTLACWPAKPPGFGHKPLFKLGDLSD
jgi:hypothetical protein